MLLRTCSQRLGIMGSMPSMMTRILMSFGIETECERHAFHVKRLVRDADWQPPWQWAGCSSAC